MTETLTETRDTVLAGIPAIHICGDDYAEIDEFVERLKIELHFKEVVEWNMGYGLVDFNDKHCIDEKKELSDAISEAMYDRDSADKTIFLLKNAHLVLEGENNRQNLSHFQQTILHIKKFNEGKAVIIYSDEKRFIPDELASLVYYVELKPPTREELAVIVKQFSESTAKISVEAQKKLSETCVGMNADVFNRILKKAALDKTQIKADEVLKIAQAEKKQSVDKSGVLKYIEIDTSLDSVGGLDNLKKWLEEKKPAIMNSVEARAAGIEPAKGILLAGMPGCGKSLSAKAIARYFNYPLLALDIGTLMSKYVGESEDKLHRALRLAENSSPCVLWVDEIEKAFAGLNGDDSGVTKRLFGSFLTWLQEKKHPVFVIATANDVSVLPPEFLRRGRFDEIFYVDFPTDSEREKIFEIHIKKIINKNKIEKEPDNSPNHIDFKDLALYEHDVPDPKDKTKTIRVVASYGYAGSDIEAVVNSAAEIAWRKNRTLSQPLLKQQMKDIKPLKEVLKEKIDVNKKKFGEYKFKPASSN